MHTYDVLSSAEAAERLDIDRSTLSRWVASGRIAPVIRGGGTNGAMFFSSDDVDELIGKLAALSEAERAIASRDEASKTA